MVITEGEGTVVGDLLVHKDNSKKQARVYVHFWPRSGARVEALEMDAATYRALYELRTGNTIPSPFHDKVITVKRGSVVFDGEIASPPPGLALVDLNLIARIRTMAEGTKYEEAALGFIRDSEGDTVYLAQTAEGLAAKLAAELGQTAVSPS